MRKSKNYKKFLIHNLYEIPALIPLIFFSFIQYQSSTVALFRAFNLIPVFRLLILLRLMSLFKAAKHLKARPFIYLIILFISSTIFGAIGMLVVEEANPHSTIKNLGDAFWFAITTLTISGFGDVVPVTAMGRVISVILILVGLTSILGFISNFGIDVIEDRLNKKLGANENKQYIKNRIDILEQLHASEVEALINEINSLHQKIYNGNISCIKCGFLYPKDSVYCNKCGNKIK